MTCELKWIAICGALLLGEVCGFTCEAFAPLWPLALVASLATILLGFGFSKRGWLFPAVALLGLTLSLRTTGLHTQTLDEVLEINAGSPVPADFKIGNDLRLLTTGEGRTLASFKGEIGPVPVRVRLSLPSDGRLPKPGETWRCAGFLQRTGEGPFGQRRSFWVERNDASAQPIEDGSRSLSLGLRRLRARLAHNLTLGLPVGSEAAKLNRAMILGEREQLPARAKDDFIRAGTIHIFAISGLHVLFVAQLIAFLLQLAGTPSRTLGVFLVPLVWYYVLLTGCAPSAIRAATMASVYYAAPLFWRRPSGFTSWAVAFLLTYTFDPTQLFDVGCGLSFTVMFALILWNDLIKPFSWPPFASRLSCIAIAWLASVPLAAHVFGRMTPGGLVTNLLVLPLAAISVTTSLLGMMLAFICEPLAAHLNNFAALSTELMTALSRIVADCSWSSQTVEPWSFTTCALWYALALGLIFGIRSLLQRQKERGGLCQA